MKRRGKKNGVISVKMEERGIEREKIYNNKKKQ